MKPSKLLQKTESPDADAKFRDHEEKNQACQAEQPSRPGEVPPSQEQGHQHGQGDKGADDDQADADDQPEHPVPEQPSQPASPSRSPLPKIVQSPTIQGVVLRCVTVHDNIICSPLLTSSKPGTMLTETTTQRGSQARQQCTTPEDKGQDDQTGGQADTLQQPQDQDQRDVQEGDQAGREDEPDDHPDAQRADEPDEQSSHRAVHLKSVQPLTIQRAVLRCVSVQQNTNCITLLTSTKPGTIPLCTQQAEQKPRTENNQASPQRSQAGKRGQAEQICSPEITCDSLLPSKAKGTGEAEQPSSQIWPQNIVTETERRESRAEQFYQKPYLLAAGGTLDPATPLPKLMKFEFQDEMPTAPQTKLNNEVLAEPNPKPCPNNTNHIPTNLAELDNVQVAVIAEPNSVTTTPPVPQAELNTAAPAVLAELNHNPGNNDTEDEPNQAATSHTTLKAELNTAFPAVLAVATTPPAPQAELNTASSAILAELTHNQGYNETQDEQNLLANSHPSPQAGLNTAVNAVLAMATTTQTPHSKLNNKPKVNGEQSDKFAHTPTKLSSFPTPKRKRSPQDNPKENQKFPKLILPTLKKPNQEPKPKTNPLKPNPHPHWNQQEFVKFEGKILLLKHTGLAKTTKKSKPKPKPNTVETNPPTHHKPAVTFQPSTPLRKISKNFTQLAKMFQQHTPPSRPNQRKKKKTKSM